MIQIKFIVHSKEIKFAEERVVRICWEEKSGTRFANYMTCQCLACGTFKKCYQVTSRGQFSCTRFLKTLAIKLLSL